ncbi:MAG: DsbA family protein [Desulfobacteraceae bacterium]|nr:DsbA family protein [Desulfobacteraceae bacterium]
MTGRIEKLKQQYGVTVRSICYPLRPDTPEEGLSMEELFAGRGVDIPAVLARLERAASDCGVPFGPRTHTYNSRRAHELAKWAATLGKEDEFHLAVFRAHFVYGLNIARIAVLIEAACSVGLDGSRVEAILAQGTFCEAVDRDWEYSRRCGIVVAPTFQYGGRRLGGAQPYRSLEKLILGQTPHQLL